MAGARDQRVRLTRGGASLSEVWPAEAGGRVALVGSGEGAEALEAQLRAAGATVVRVGDSEWVVRSAEGPMIAEAAVCRAVLDADRVVVVGRVEPHRQLGLSGPRLALMGALAPAARERLWRGASTPEALNAALDELAELIAPDWAVAVVPATETLVSGPDAAAVEQVARYCLGLDVAELPPTVGLAPEQARREGVVALPEPPERYPAVDQRLCTRCGTCVAMCPTGAVTEGAAGEPPVVFELAACLRCGICAAACPDFAISGEVRPLAARVSEPRGLVLSAEPVAWVEGREERVPPEDALRLGEEAAEPPARRPAWLEGYEPRDRFELRRRRSREDSRRPRQVLAADGAVRLLIAPVWGIKGNRTSLGIAYLAAVLDAEGIDAHVVDLARELREWDPALDEALGVIGNPDPNGGIYGPRMPLLLQVLDPEVWETCPDLARRVHESAARDAARIIDPGALHGLTVADSNVHYAFALGAAIRRLGGRVVLGGPTMGHTPTAELALKAGVADAVVVGEGEAAMVALAKAQAEGRWEALAGAGPIPGLWLRTDEGVRRTPNFRNRALDALPFPDWRGQEMARDFVPILAARGCVTRCSFCSEQTINPKFSQRSVEDVLAEMDVMAERFDVTTFEFNDDLLNGNVKWLRAFCEALIARGSPYRWQGLCRPHRLDRELLTSMRDAGCVQLSYGVQHFSWRMLQIMGRKEAPDPLMKVLEDTLELGIQAFIDVILGHPGETEEDVQITIDTVRDLMRRYPNVAINLNPYNQIYGAGTDLDPDRYGVRIERFSEALPEPLAGLQGLAERYMVAFEQTPDAATVVERVNRLADVVFAARMPPKIPILNEELPFCNDNCLHCGVAEIMKTANVVPFETIRRNLQWLAPRSGGRVMFAVSELTIRPDFIKIVKAARRAGMRTIALVTNGRMFAYPEFTEKAVAAGLSHALVSVYGPTPRVHQALTRTPKSFEQTIAGLRALLAQPSVKVMTNTVVTKKNYRHLPALVELLAGLGVDNVNLSFVQIIGNAERYQRALVPKIEEVLPHLRAAVDMGVDLGLKMGIGGLPYCVLKGYEHHFGVDDLTYIENGDQSADNITSRSPYDRTSAKCARCAMSAVCLGLQEAYLEQHGDDVLEPYHGRRLARRPDSEIVRALFPEMVPRAPEPPAKRLSRAKEGGASEGARA